MKTMFELVIFSLHSYVGEWKWDSTLWSAASWLFWDFEHSFHLWRPCQSLHGVFHPQEIGFMPDSQKNPFSRGIRDTLGCLCQWPGPFLNCGLWLKKQLYVWPFHWLHGLSLDGEKLFGHDLGHRPILHGWTDGTQQICQQRRNKVEYHQHFYLFSHFGLGYALCFHGLVHSNFILDTILLQRNLLEF